MSKEKSEHDLVIVVYPGRNSAGRVYEILEKLQEQGAIEMETAAIVYRQENGKLKMEQKGRVTAGGGAVRGGLLGLLLAGLAGGPIGGVTVAGALIGGLIGGRGHKKRRELKQLLDTKLGSSDSALAVLINSADWQTVLDKTAHFSGLDLIVELTPETRDQLEQISGHEEMKAAIASEIDVENA
jgi:uncharacterized membrane protein